MKLYVFSALIICCLILLVPFFIYEPTDSELDRIVELQDRYFEAAPEDRWKIYQEIHYLGGHIDEGHETCEWTYYHNKWKVTLFKLGFFDPFKSE